MAGARGKANIHLFKRINESLANSDWRSPKLRTCSFYHTSKAKHYALKSLIIASLVGELPLFLFLNCCVVVSVIVLANNLSRVHWRKPLFAFRKPKDSQQNGTPWCSRRPRRRRHLRKGRISRSHQVQVRSLLQGLLWMLRLIESILVKM